MTNAQIKLDPQNPPSTKKLFIRAIRLHCPACGSHGLIRRWFWIQPQCPTCRLRTERVEGQTSGSIGYNTILSFGVLLIFLMVGFLVTWPNTPVFGFSVLATVLTISAPFFFLPFSRTLWMATDLRFRWIDETDVFIDPNND